MKIQFSQPAPLLKLAACAIQTFSSLKTDPAGTLRFKCQIRIYRPAYSHYNFFLFRDLFSWGMVLARRWVEARLGLISISTVFPYLACLLNNH